MNTRSPLVLPARPRRWRDILLLRPLSQTPYTATIVTRHGRLQYIVLPGGAWVLSDYIDWPSEIYEVDMRVRQIVLGFEVETLDRDVMLDLALQLSYRVAQPAQVAFSTVDPEQAVEQAVIHALRRCARSYGVDQIGPLQTAMHDLFSAGGSLRERMHAIGFEVSHVDLALEPTLAAQQYAEQLRLVQRERPWQAEYHTTSLHSEQRMRITVAGAYQLRTRSVQGPDMVALDESLRGALAGMMQRLSNQFPPEQADYLAQLIQKTLQHSPVLTLDSGRYEVALLNPVATVVPIPEPDLARAASRPTRATSILTPDDRSAESPTIPGMSVPSAAHDQIAWLANEPIPFNSDHVQTQPPVKR